MTREERALDLLRDHIPPAAKRLQIGSPGGECWILEVVLAFADAEAAAMRERAAGHCDKLAEQFTGKLGKGPFLDEITKGCATIVTDAATAIRALPATGEVGRG